MAELKVVFRAMAAVVPMLAAVATKVELVISIKLVAVAFDVAVYAMLDDPVPPTREKSPE
jgi:hypothetical protein